MSGGLDALALKEEDVQKFLACGTHLGSTNSDFQMEQYVFQRKADGKERFFSAPEVFLRNNCKEMKKKNSFVQTDLRPAIVATPDK